MICNRIFKTYNLNLRIVIRKLHNIKIKLNNIKIKLIKTLNNKQIIMWISKNYINN